MWLNPSLVFERGCRLCVQAESGSGKSSLVSFLYGDRDDYQGEIRFNGDDIRTFDAERWCDLRVGNLALLPQEMRMFPELTVMRNLRLKNALTNHKTDAEMKAMLERFGIADKADKPLGQLSIGQQQRVAIIRAVCQPFDFIMLDEPVSHLDRDNNLIAAALIEEEAQRQGAGVISTSVGNPLLLENATYISL